MFLAGGEGGWPEMMVEMVRQPSGGVLAMVEMVRRLGQNEREDGLG